LNSFYHFWNFKRNCELTFHLLDFISKSYMMTSGECRPNHYFEPP
jgi:hypothetical protein